MRRRGASLTRTLAGVVALTTLWSISLPASARPTDESQPAPLDLADRNGDRVSDGLTADLKNRGPDERVDVVVTWTRRPDVDAARRAAGHFDVKAQFGVINGFAASLTAGQIHALSNVPGVFRVEEDFEVSVLSDEANTDFGTTRARTDFGINGAGVVFCVVDTGVDSTHEQLDGGKVIAWRDVINGQLTAYDDQGHGTHVASILGGDGVGGPDASRYQGVAPGVSIAAVKVLNSAGTGSESQVIQGIDWCIAQQVDGISMSLGDPAFTDGNDALSQAVDNAVLNHGIVSVIAAGNSGDGPGSVGSPGAARQAITVGAAVKVADGLRLAGFSSRGPTLDGRLKPDVVSPGVAITAADANTGSRYVAFSGTSMATPFTAGVVALMLECNGALTPSQIKSTLGSTATDLGPAGADNNWGNGLIDGHEAVASACGSSGGMALPTHNHVQGTVPTNGTYTHSFTVGTDGVGKPISATILIQGQLICTLGIPDFCFIWEWSPDLDARLVGPSNNELWKNECPARGECGTVGQTEVITATANQAGEYRIEIYAFTGSPNNGLGGAFVMDLFYGPVGGGPPPPTNNPPVANNDSYSTNEDTPLSVASPGVLGNDTDPDGDSLTAAVVTGPTAGSLSLSANGSFTYTPTPNFNGADSFVYRADDGRGGTAQATVTITVNPVNDPPIANAGPDQTVTDTDGNGSEVVTLNGTGSTDPDGDPLTYSWSEGSTVLGTGVSPTVALSVGSHNVTLTVNDESATATDTVTITVQPQPADTTIHVGDLDGASSWNSSRTRWKGTVTVKVHDAADSLVSGAKVFFSLSDGTTRSCTTGTNGACLVVSKAKPANVASLTFTVTNVTKSGQSYAPGSNHDPDGDSNGTAIVATRPA
jgi:serine protease AprX